MSAILWGYQQIQQKIIDIIELDAQVKTGGTQGIKSWSYEQPTNFGGLGWPFGWVEQLTSPIRPSTAGRTASYAGHEHLVKFRIIVLAKDPDAKKAMQKAQDILEYVQKALNADVTLGDLADNTIWDGNLEVLQALPQEGTEQVTIFALAITLTAVKER